MSTAAAIPAAWSGAQVNAAATWWDNIEVDASTFEYVMPGRVQVVTESGTRIATFYDENRVPVQSLEDLPDHLIDAVLAIEDRKFYEHGPIDVRGTGRAFLTNATDGTQQGGSSITQQYVKLLRAASGETDAERRQALEGTLNRKVIELKYASELEKNVSKDDILLGYLNAAYFGDGAYGVGAAARNYFNVGVKDLTVGQSAMLAGLLRNPTGYDPTKDLEAATNRRDTVLAAMAVTGAISEQERDDTMSQPLKAGSHALPNGCTTSKYPYYCDWIRSTLLSDPVFGGTERERAENLRRGGFTVVAALDEKAMKVAQRELDKALGRQQVAAATAVVEPGTGRTLAIALTRDYKDIQFNIPVQGQLQVGSTFKPITYAAALTSGMNPSAKISAPHPYTPSFGNSPRGGFKNLDATSRGPVSASTAMKYSVNTWFVRLAEQTGVQAVADTAFEMGMRSLNPGSREVSDADLSITLGTFETTVLDTANTYATLAASGVRCTPTPILSVHDTATGGDLGAPDTNCHQAIPAAVADTVTQSLKATASPGGTAQDVTVDGQAWVGKTGTTNNWGATWFAGYTRHMASAVWVGDPRGPAHPTRNVTAWGTFYPRVYGSTISGPLFSHLMTDLHRGLDRKKFPTPGAITVSGRSIPDVTGVDVASAVAVLERSGLTVTVTYDPTAQATGGVVVDQSPAGGVTIANDVTITVAGARD